MPTSTTITTHQEEREEAIISKNNNNNINNNKSGIIKNFRNVGGGITNIYRCASIDGLGESQPTTTTNNIDQFVLNHVGLILDLRSPREINKIQSQNWIQKANNNNRSRRKIHIIDEDNNNEYNYETSTTIINKNNNNRYVVRINILSPQRFMSYIENNWLKKIIIRRRPNSPPSPSPPSPPPATQQKQKKQQRRKLRMKNALMERGGLSGLNEAILETGKLQLNFALQIITLHLEYNINDKVVIHCVQGKDRTGMLAMLLQSILGTITDEEIIEDYYMSNIMLNNDGGDSNTGSAAVRDVGLEEKKESSSSNNTSTMSSSSSSSSRQQQQQQQQGVGGRGGNSHRGFGHDNTPTSSNIHLPSSSSSEEESTRRRRQQQRRREKRHNNNNNNMYSGTNRQDMVTTMKFLRHKYGSISPGYLDSIGFDHKWRSRLRSVVVITTQRRRHKSKL